jgi:antiviral helicase SKI2
MGSEVGNRLDGRTRGLKTIPPGFTRGLRLPGDEGQDENLAELDEVLVINHRKDLEEVRYSILQQAEVLTRVTHNQDDKVLLSENDGVEIMSVAKPSELDDLLPTSVRY